MVSIVEQTIIDRMKFLDRYRRVYLVSICKEMGIQTDLRIAALAEARAMIELADSLIPKDIIRTTLDAGDSKQE